MIGTITICPGLHCNTQVDAKEPIDNLLALICRFGVIPSCVSGTRISFGRVESTAQLRTYHDNDPCRVTFIAKKDRLRWLVGLPSRWEPSRKTG